MRLNQTSRICIFSNLLWKCAASTLATGSNGPTRHRVSYGCISYDGGDGKAMASCKLLSSNGQAVKWIRSVQSFTAAFRWHRVDCIEWRIGWQRILTKLVEVFDLKSTEYLSLSVLSQPCDPRPVSHPVSAPFEITMALVMKKACSLKRHRL